MEHWINKKEWIVFARRNIPFALAGPERILQEKK